MSIQQFVEAIQYGSGRIYTYEPIQVIHDLCDGIDLYLGGAITSLVESPTSEVHLVLEDRSIPLRHTLIIYSVNVDGSSVYRQPHGDPVSCADAETLNNSLIELLKTPEVANEIDRFVIE